jgi:hypothetical protein
MWPVDKRVGNVKNNDPSLIEPVSLAWAARNNQSEALRVTLLLMLFERLLVEPATALCPIVHRPAALIASDGVDRKGSAARAYVKLRWMPGPNTLQNWTCHRKSP